MGDLPIYKIFVVEHLPNKETKFRPTVATLYDDTTGVALEVFLPKSFQLRLNLGELLQREG